MPNPTVDCQRAPAERTRVVGAGDATREMPVLAGTGSPSFLEGTFDGPGSVHPRTDRP